MKRPYNPEFYDIQITVCPIYLTKQKQMLYALMDQKQVEWTDEMREGLDGLLNLLDYIEDEVKFRDED
jgi:hypothetical protein